MSTVADGYGKGNIDFCAATAGILQRTPCRKEGSRVTGFRGKKVKENNRERKYNDKMQ